MSRSVLITGAAGNIGTKLRDHFSYRGWSVRGLDVRDEGRPDIVEADLSVWNERWVSLFDGVDAVVHLAGDPRSRAPWSVIQTLNIDLSLNVFEAAARAGVRRLIFASSNWVLAGHRFSVVELAAQTEPAPVNPYGVSKLVGERLGRSYAERWGMSVICLRIGYIRPGDNRPGSDMGWGAWGQAMWLSNRDLCDGFEKAILAADDVRFAILNLMSDNPGMRWDIETTRRVIGYDPKDGHAPVTTREQDLGAGATERMRALIDASEAWLRESRL